MDSEELEGWEEVNMQLISHGFRRAGRSMKLISRGFSRAGRSMKLISHGFSRTGRMGRN
jgi:hypothetical protein